MQACAAWGALGLVPVSGCHSGRDIFISISISSQHGQREIHDCSSGACGCPDLLKGQEKGQLVAPVSQSCPMSPSQPCLHPAQTSWAEDGAKRE